MVVRLLIIFRYLQLMGYPDELLIEQAPGVAWRAKMTTEQLSGADLDQEPEWGSAVNAWSGEKGVDHVVEVGGPATLAQSINACRVNGNIVLIGVLTGVKGDVPTAALMAKQINLKGIIVGSREHQNDFVNALEASGIKPVIDTSFSLDELAKAFEYEVNGKHFGKICIDI